VRPSRRFTASAALVVVALAISSSGCLVLGLNRFVDDAMVLVDDRWVGTWKDADDSLTVTIERSEWQSYRLSYDHPIAAGQLTAYLFQSGAFQYLDVMPVRGQDPGLFTLAVHALMRVRLDGQTITAWPLSYDWFRKGLDDHTAPRLLAPVLDERDQVVATADAAALREWLRTRTDDDPAFGPAATFQKMP
jgi:hypothetical protein